MASIIRMTSGEFLKKFCKKYNYKHYNFILVSEDIKNKKTYGNVYSIPALLPPTKVLAKYINSTTNKKEYLNEYYKHLATGPIEMYITTIVKLCVMENTDVILLCSDSESEYKYLIGICNYIEHIYGVETYKFNEYDKNPSKCNSAYNKKDAVKIIHKKVKAYKKFNVSPLPVKMSKKEVKVRLESMDKAALIKMCKNYDIKSKGKKRDELIKSIMKLT